jgi:hypothetical protein
MNILDNPEVNDPQLQKLVKLLKLWLIKNEIDGDTHFYSIAEWRERGEDYLNESDLVITTEGGLNFKLNYGDTEEFDDLVNSFGYYYEMGHSWNLGFYKLEDEETVSIAKTYSQKLRDPRWIKKRDTIKERAGFKCEDCNNEQNLQVHHCYYLYDFEPWEYPYDALRCLCAQCHKKREVAERILRGNLAALKTSQLEDLTLLTNTGLYWYPEKQMFDFINCIGPDRALMKEKFEELLLHKTDNQY